MMTYKETITKEEIDALPLLEYPDGEIRVVDTILGAQKACVELSAATLLGFDTETRPSFQKGISYKIALMQLSMGNVCYLFRLNILGIPKCLAQVLANDKITKVGLSLRDDFHQIMKRDKIALNGFVDLQKIVPQFGIQELSLKKIYAIVFGKKISKAQQLTNWEAPVLTDKQQMYAAIDAWACVDLYKQLVNR